MKIARKNLLLALLLAVFAMTLYVYAFFRIMNSVGQS